MLEVLNLGDKLDVKRINYDNDENRRTVYASQLVEIVSETRIKITMPTLGTTIVPLEIGEVYECVFYSNQSVMRAEFTVLSRFKEGNLPVCVLEIKTPLKKVQRREFYRFECTIPLKYRNAERGEKIPKESLSDLEWKNGIILDLSGGGIRIAVEEKLDVSSYIQLKMILSLKDEYKEFYLYGEVINSKIRENNIRLHECRVQFENISEADQDMIVAYIFQEERKKRNTI